MRFGNTFDRGANGLTHVPTSQSMLPRTESEEDQLEEMDEQEEIVRKHNDQLLDHALKEDIIDAVNDLKGQRDIWDLSDAQVKQCDNVIKKMVFNQGSGQQSVAQTYDLVRGVFDVLREVMKEKASQTSKHSQQVKDFEVGVQQNELKMVKNLEIVVDVFRRAAGKVAKTGEREWKDVIE